MAYSPASLRRLRRTRLPLPAMLALLGAGFASAASGQALPNLTPYRPDGWSDKIVVAKTTGTKIDGSPFFPTDTLYLSWAVINNGSAATAARFYTDLYVDGVRRQSWYLDPPLNPNVYAFVEDYSIGSLGVGTHTIRIKADSTNAIAESNKADNEYTKTITVSVGSSCAPSPTALCLNNGRFQVQASWRVPSQGTSGVANAVRLTSDTGYFWFFNSANIELVIKVLDARGVNGKFWVFYGALSDVEYTITVTDTATGAVKTYFNPQGRLASVADTSAFSASSAAPVTFSVVTPQDRESPVPEQTRASAIALDGRISGGDDQPSEVTSKFSSLDALQAGAPCAPNTTTLCLNGNRFAVQVNWRVPSQGRSGVGTAERLTGDTGYFWFFNSANIELVVKVLDGRGVNGKFWVFYGALSDVEYTLTVSDTTTGAVKTYFNTVGGLASVADTSAFPREPDTSVLTDAFNFAGTYPTPTNVTYTNKSGQRLVTVAIPDQIFMVVSPALLSGASATQLIAVNGGTVIAQMPVAGLYWIRVQPGAMDSFISAVRGNPAVIHVGPNVPLTGSQTGGPPSLFGDTATTPLSPGSSWVAQFDLFRLAPGNNACGLTHGLAVNSFLEQGGLSTARYDMTMIDRGTNQVALDQGLLALALGSDLGFALARAAKGGSLDRHKLVVNISLRPGGDPNDGRDRSICETNPANPICFCPPPPNAPSCRGSYAAWKSDFFAFFVGIASALRYMPQELRDNTVVVVSAGNAGLDLTREIGLLRSFFDNLPQMLIVGSLENGQPFSGHNHSTDPSHMIYAPGVSTPVPGTAGCRSSGTSFAAPAVANLVAQLAQRFPTLTSAQLVTAIQNAAPRVNGLWTMPTLAQAVAAAEAIAQPPPPGQLRFNAPAALPSAVVGTAYDYSFCDPRPSSLTALCGTFPPTTNPTGGAPPYHFQLDSGVGFPPFGISLNLNGILSGTPSAEGNNTFRVCAVDTVGSQSCQTTSLTIQAGIDGRYQGTYNWNSPGGFCLAGAGNWNATVRVQNGFVTGTWYDDYHRETLPLNARLNGSTATWSVGTGADRVDFTGTFGGGRVVGTFVGPDASWCGAPTSFRGTFQGDRVGP